MIRTIRTPLVRLATSYLLVMVLVSIIFSSILYFTSTRTLTITDIKAGPAATSNVPDSPAQPALPPIDPSRSVYEQTTQLKQTFLRQLVALNIGVFIVGSYMSYYLARRTLRPIEMATQEQVLFYTNASHELKTPLAAMRLENEVALRNPLLTLADAKAALRQNIRQVVKLEGLSRSLLELAYSNGAKAMLSAVEVDDAIKDATLQVAALAQEKDITITATSSQLTVTANYQQLVRVLVILLDNAVKYSPTGTTVTIASEVGKRVGAIKITNEGHAISADDLPHIFDRFYQADVSRKSEGYGLGLPIAKQLMESMNGSISVKSFPNKTTVFTINFASEKKI